MIIIIDDFLSEKNNKKVVDYFTLNPTRNSIFVNGTLNQFLEDKSFISECIDVAKNHFDLSNLVGCEMWTQLNTKVHGWHRDRDEVEYNKTKTEVYPLCSIIYYSFVNNLVGGKFITETEKITPKTNRLILMSPGILHNVEEFTGIRSAVLINTWNYKIEFDGTNHISYISDKF